MPALLPALVPAVVPAVVMDVVDQEEPPYHVRLDQFEGPLDLLLHLIKKSEINIYDIPIALITAQYLQYLDAARSLNLTVAGEFLVMAATLLKIKSKMLLPSEEGDPEEEDGPDPREELVRQLLEYKQFKDAAQQLNERERLWREMFPKEPFPLEHESSPELPLERVTLFDLVDALQEIIARLPDRRVLEIMPDQLTVRDRMNVILDKLEGHESVIFGALFEDECHRLVVVVTFMALLELIRVRLVRVFQAEHYGPILVTRADSLILDEEREDRPVQVEHGREEQKDGLDRQR